MKPKFILLGLLLILLSACQPAVTLTATVIPTLSQPQLLVTVRVTDIYGQTAICSIDVAREEDVWYLFLTEGDDNLFGIQLADGQPCGIVPADEQGNNIIDDWKVTVLNQSNQVVMVRGELLYPGREKSWERYSPSY